MTSKEIEKRLTADGWSWKETRGGHKHFVHPEKPGKITVPQHKGDLKRKTAESILKQAGLK